MALCRRAATQRTGYPLILTLLQPGKSAKRAMLKVLILAVTSADSVLSCCSEASECGRALSLQRLEGLLGERAFMQMLGGQHSYLTAAIKSLPLQDSDAGAAGPLPLEERGLAEALRQQCLDALEGVLPMLAESLDILLAAHAASC